MFTPIAVGWSTCRYPDCIGVRLADASVCLAHAAELELDEFEAELRRISEHGAIDARGVRLTEELLGRLLAAAPHDSHDHVILRNAQFDRATFDWFAGFNGATFEGETNFGTAVFKGQVEFHGANFKAAARFPDAKFEYPAVFEEVTFEGDALFLGVTFESFTSFKRATFKRTAGFFWGKFKGSAVFEEATFEGDAWFEGVRFEGDAWFKQTAFEGEAGFLGSDFKRKAQFAETIFRGSVGLNVSRFEGDAEFTGATFEGQVSLSPAVFHGEASFDRAVFIQARQLGPLLAGRQVSLSDVVFEKWVQLEIATATLHLSRAQFLGGAQIRVRWASIVLDDASLALPSILSGVPAFKGWSEERFRAEWQRRPPVPRAEPWRPRLLTLARSDVAGLRIGNVDVQACRFVGAHNLDKLRIEGSPLFALPPTGWTWRRLRGEGLPIWRWTPRLTLAEEQRWRRDRPDLQDTPAGRPHPQRKGWYPPKCRASELPEEPVVVPVQLASLYRELRKGREDAKDEPGAADFYYGEMEMRRLSQATPLAERFVLWLYWLTSGYGLRGSRALTCLVVVVLTLAALFHAIGFYPSHPPTPRPFWDSLLYTAESTVSLGSNNVALTAGGRTLRIVLRLTGPILLGLALLSVRNRVKR
jgi:uncharacterized protein YjbI with pentapeptide repeats